MPTDEQRARLAQLRAEHHARMLEVVARIKAEQDARLGPAPSRPARLPGPGPEPPAPLPALIDPPDPDLVAALLQTPLSLLDAMLEVRVPWLPVTLWFVPGEIAVEALSAEGISRGRIWTAGELLDVLTFPPQTVRTLARANLEFHGDVAVVRRDSRRQTPT